jgi:hypothetical protein
MQLFGEDVELENPKQELRITCHHFIEFSEFFVGDKVFALFGIPFLETNGQNLKWRKIHFFLNQCFAISALILAVLNPICSAEPLDFLVIIEDLGVFLAYGGILAKWFPLEFLYRKKITQLLIDLEDFYPQNTYDQKIFEVGKYLKEIKKKFNMESILALLTIIAHNFTPIFEQIYALIVGKPHKLSAMLNIYYPFDQFQHGFYEFTLIYIMWIGQISRLIVPATDFLFISCAQLIIMGLNDLKNQISELDLRKEEEAVEKLKKIIETHKKYLKMIKVVGETNSFALLCDLFGVMGVLCLFGFLSLVII